MSLKGVIVFLLSISVIVLVISLFVLLASAALYGALILPILCVGFMLFFFFATTFLNKDN